MLAMENMANTMQKMVDEARDQNPTQKVTAGEGKTLMLFLSLFLFLSLSLSLSIYIYIYIYTYIYIYAPMNKFSTINFDEKLILSETNDIGISLILQEYLA